MIYDRCFHLIEDVLTMTKKQICDGWCCWLSDKKTVTPTMTARGYFQFLRYLIRNIIFLSLMPHQTYKGFFNWPSQCSPHPMIHTQKEEPLQPSRAAEPWNPPTKKLLFCKQISHSLYCGAGIFWISSLQKSFPLKQLRRPWKILLKYFWSTIQNAKKERTEMSWRWLLFLGFAIFYNQSVVDFRHFLIWAQNV